MIEHVKFLKYFKIADIPHITDLEIDCQWFRCVNGPEYLCECLTFNLTKITFYPRPAVDTTIRTFTIDRKARHATGTVPAAYLLTTNTI
jgi:hypothetical protein